MDGAEIPRRGLMRWPLIKPVAGPLSCKAIAVFDIEGFQSKRQAAFLVESRPTNEDIGVWEDVTPPPENDLPVAMATASAMVARDRKSLDFSYMARVC